MELNIKNEKINTMFVETARQIVQNNTPTIDVKAKLNQMLGR